MLGHHTLCSMSDREFSRLFFYQFHPFCIYSVAEVTRYVEDSMFAIVATIWHFDALIEISANGKYKF